MRTRLCVIMWLCNQPSKSNLTNFDCDMVVGDRSLLFLPIFSANSHLPASNPHYTIGTYQRGWIDVLPPWYVTPANWKRVNPASLPDSTANFAPLAPGLSECSIIRIENCDLQILQVLKTFKNDQECHSVMCFTTLKNSTLSSLNGRETTLLL